MVLEKNVVVSKAFFFLLTRPSRNMPYMKLESIDGEIFKVDIEIAKFSNTLMMIREGLGLDQDDDDDQPVFLPQVKGVILRKVIEWVTHHKNAPAPPEDDADRGIDDWDQEWSTYDIDVWDQEWSTDDIDDWDQEWATDETDDWDQERAGLPITRTTLRLRKGRTTLMTGTGSSSNRI